MLRGEIEASPALLDQRMDIDRTQETRPRALVTWKDGGEREVGLQQAGEVPRHPLKGRTVTNRRRSTLDAVERDLIIGARRLLMSAGGTDACTPSARDHWAFARQRDPDDST